MFASGAPMRSWRLSGSGIVSTIVPFATATTLPAIARTRYQTLAADNGGIFDPNEGGVFAAVHPGI